MQLDKIKPLYPTILIKRYLPESYKQFGDLKIHLPDTQNYKNRRCQVLSTHNRYSFVSPGEDVELVVFDGTPLDPLDHPGVEICSEKDILCVIKNDSIKPLFNRVVVVPEVPPKETLGGIILPDRPTNDRPYKGTVIAIGPGIETKSGSFIPLDVSIGDTIYFTQFKGTPVKLNDVTYMIIDGEDINTKVEEAQ